MIALLFFLNLCNFVVFLVWRHSFAYLTFFDFIFPIAFVYIMAIYQIWVR